MLTKMMFGECLKLLLSTFDISMNRLSRAINVDSSLVNRWIHGKRIPQLSTSYIENISEYLSKNILNSYQQKLLHDSYIKICGKDTEETPNNKDMIRKMLLESQGCSLDYIHKNNKDWNEMFEETPPFKKHFDDKSLMFPETSLNHHSHKINCAGMHELSSEDKLIQGAKNVYEAGIQLLENAALQKSKKDNTIYVSFNNDVDILNTQSTNLIHWRNSLLKVIENGWNVLFLVRFNNNSARTIRLIKFAKPLILTGKFIPYYIKKYDVFSSGIETIIVPGIGALSCFITKPYSGIDCALYFKNISVVNMLSSYFNILVTTNCHPLIKHYADENTTEYCRRLLEYEESMGVRYFNKYGISIFMLPDALYQKLLQRTSLSKDEKQKAYEYYKKRLHAFLVNVKHNEQRDMFFTDSLDHILKQRQFYFYYNSGIEKIEITIPEITEVLKNIITLLKNNINYRIALIHHTNQYELISADIDCLVKERKAAFLEAYTNTTCKPSIRLSIEEPMLIKAMEDYYKEIWEQIAPVCKNKNEVINYFDAKLHQLLQDES